MKSSTQSSFAPGSVQTNRLNILWAFDGSEHSLAALQLIEDLHVDRIAVTALCVLPTQYFESYASMQSGLDQAQKRLESRGVRVQTVLKAGNPPATLNAYADETASDLILIGAKGLRATLGILLGGVAQQVKEADTTASSASSLFMVQPLKAFYLKQPSGSLNYYHKKTSNGLRL